LPARIQHDVVHFDDTTGRGAVAFEVCSPAAQYRFEIVELVDEPGLTAVVVERAIWHDCAGYELERDDDGPGQDDEQPVDRRHDERKRQVKRSAPGDDIAACARRAGAWLTRIDRRAGGSRWTDNIPEMCR